MKLKDDKIVSVNNFDYQNQEFISIITDKGTGKRIRLSEFPISSRALRGLLVIREVKTNPYKIIKTFITDNKKYIGIKNGSIKELKVTELPIFDRYSTGSQISKSELNDAYIVSELLKKEDSEKDISLEEIPNVQKESKKEQISLQEIDDRLMTIDDFLD